MSGNDLLLWWASDEVTRLAVLYLASFGNPRKFARTARALGRTMPILVVDAGRSAAGQRLARARTAVSQGLPPADAAAVAVPQLTRQALFEQAGVIATANLGELLDTAALLAAQPVPAGIRVAVVSNARGAGVLAADACGDVGLQVASLAPDTQQALRDLLPATATVAGPVDATAAVTPGAFRRCLELVGADPGVDAVLALTATNATGDLVAEVQAARLPVPVAAAVMDQLEVVRLLPGAGEDSPDVPAYAYPESASRALGHAARYGAWRAAPHGQVPGLGGLRPGRARELAAGFLAGAPKGGWLSQDQTAQLVGCYGVRLADRIGVSTEESAADAAAHFGTAVALKADLPSVIRPIDVGAVLLDLHDAEEVRRGFRSLRETFAGRLAAVYVQPMITSGVKVKISILQEQVFGPLVLLGPGGRAAEALAGRAARLAPLTATDADDLIRSARVTRLLPGRAGTPAADLDALRDMLLRVSRMADDLPQLAELELPAIASLDGTRAVDARARIQAAELTDAYLRRLP